jgi:hypothetical protein
MKTPLRIFFCFLFFIGFNPFSSQAIIRSKLRVPPSNMVSSPPIIKEKSKSIKQRIAHYLLKKISSSSIDTEKKTNSTRVLNIVLITFFSLATIYLLQGTFWLTVVALLVLAIFKFRKWKKNRPPQPPIVTKGNQYGKKSLKAFLIGLSSFVLGFFSIILAIVSEGAAFSVVLLLAFALLGVIFLSIAIARAIKSLKLKEENNTTSIVVLVLSILLLLPILTSLLAGLLLGG